VGLAGEPGHLTDPGQQPGSTRRADPVQIGQGGAGGGEQRIEFLVRLLLALAGPFQVADQLGGDPASCLARSIPRAGPGQQRPGLSCRQVLLRPAGDQPGQQRCSWETIRVWSSPRERRRSARIRSTASCWSPATRRRPGIRVAASATECASVASVLRPCPVANTRVRRTAWAAHPPRPRPRPAAGSRCAGRCPDSPRSPRSAPATAAPLPHRPVAGRVGGIPAPARDGLIAGHDLDRGRTLVRVHPDDHLVHPSPPTRSCCACRARRALLLRAGQTPLEPLPAHCGTRSAQAR
jgi:hypothetical protein